MDGNVEIALDKLPIKRLDVIEENGLENFPHDIGYDKKQLESIQRIDFAWAVEKDSMKQKTTKKTTKPWPWQSLVENLQLAHQELSVIIDLINTVEANDAVTVAGMTRPKPLPDEVLSDLSISSATKLQCFRSAKGLEQQIAREARFYGALIRLQKNWKVRRQCTSVSTPSSEGFTIDLCDNSLSDPLAVYRSPSISSIRIDHDPAGMLAVNLPPKSCRSIQFGFLGCRSEDIPKKLVFDLVNCEAFSPSLGVNVTGIRENYLELGIGQGASAYLSLVPLGKAVRRSNR
ncbi:Mediator of rna polymerase ii transcription subunit [Thalictrum thalictroides]|uniref:Mediator of rna polymerase ii transcription subunit n=1 Tax=Thalictrum thalictroides TaxID=46969 RepID=A0A7J6VSL1_THATH|nr:Mediator of rna polymerase ii transcription subunit [Thalictrum thalictroides]